MTTEKPAHLAPKYGAQFQDATIAHAYRHRPPYPRAVFEALAARLPSGDTRALDLGCGTGDLALGLGEIVAHLDAVDPSAQMLAQASVREGSKRVHWHHNSAETFEWDAPYDLITAAESLHWMEWRVVLPRLTGALRPKGGLAVLDRPVSFDVPWGGPMRAAISRFSTNRDYQPFDLIDALVAQGLFQTIDTHRFDVGVFEQTPKDYIESFHSRNGFSRERMTLENATAFDDALKRATEPFVTVRGTLEVPWETRMVWGRPLSGPR